MGELEFGQKAPHPFRHEAVEFKFKDRSGKRDLLFLVGLKKLVGIRVVNGPQVGVDGEPYLAVVSAYEGIAVVDDGGHGAVALDEAVVQKAVGVGSEIVGGEFDLVKRLFAVHDFLKVA